MALTTTVQSPPPQAAAPLPSTARPPTDAAYIAGLLDVQGPCTAPLDAALDYLRARVDRVLPMYLLAMLPHAVATILLIDQVVAGQRTRIATTCLWITLATLWRWVWLARLQQNVQRDLREVPPTGFWSRLPAILLVRLLTNFAVTWASILAGIPAFYGLFLGGFVAPLLLESNAPAYARVRDCLGWIRYAGKRLWKVTLVMTSLSLIVLIGVFVSQTVLAGTVLPSLLGFDSADLTITLQSWAWRLRLFYLVFLVLDGYWTVACVFLYYDSQSRRMATDLRVRLLAVTEAAT